MVYNLLGRVNSPGDIKKMTLPELSALSFEIRQFLVNNVSHTGGHLASNLGVVELTIALHRVFSPPHDSIIFDVGHQSYVHKILTGRRDRFYTMRKLDGLSGFTKTSESGYDAFGAGHSSTSISAALGMCEANAITGTGGCVVAVIGDGAMTGGMAYEALNNAGRSRLPLVVVLNDNDMSISHNVGAMARILGDLRSKTTYYRIKDFVRLKVSRVPVVGKGIYRVFHKSKMALKALLSQGTIFEHMGFEYLGPVDGHDLGKTIAVLERARSLGRPVLVHVRTVKGKGYSYAEDAPEDYHGVSRFDAMTGRARAGSGRSFSDEFGDWMCAAAQQNGRICAVTAAMETGTGLSQFAKRFPTRFFDVGIAEQHAVTFAAGLARAGMLPVVAVYSTFLQRAYDQILHDVALQNLKVIFAVDRAGIVGEDGPTHHGVFDVPYLSHIPGMRIFTPESFGELAAAFDAAARLPGPSAVRYPRGRGIDGDACEVFSEYKTEGEGDVVLVTYGRVASSVRTAMEMLAQEGVSARMIKLCAVKPLPDIAPLLGGARLVRFVEEGARRGGIGEQLGALLQERGVAVRYGISALPDEFIPQGGEDELLDRFGLSPRRLYAEIMEELRLGEQDKA